MKSAAETSVLSDLTWIVSLCFLFIHLFFSLEKRFVLPHAVRGFRSWWTGCIVSGPVVRQCIVAEDHDRAKLLITAATKQKEKGSVREEFGTKVYPLELTTS